MRIHFFQHVPFEGPGIIERWALANGHTLTATKLYESPIDITIEDIDWLVIMGGPMNIYEEETYPWLKNEKAFIKQAIDSKKTVIGICLGAQLIADTLGAKVYRNKLVEIGWFPIQLTHTARESDLFGFLPDNLTVFHWHGYTFEIPTGAEHLAKSEGCDGQAFLYDGRVLALQFHIESTEESISLIVKNCGDEIVSAPFIQTPEHILSADTKQFQKINDAMEGILDRLPKPIVWVAVDKKDIVACGRKPNQWIG